VNNFACANRRVYLECCIYIFLCYDALYRVPRIAARYSIKKPRAHAISINASGYHGYSRPSKAVSLRAPIRFRKITDNPLLSVKPPTHDPRPARCKYTEDFLQLLSFPARRLAFILRFDASIGRNNALILRSHDRAISAPLI